MKKQYLANLKNILDKGTSNTLPDDRILPIIKLGISLTTEHDKHQALIKGLQKKCNVEVSELGVLKSNTKQEDLDRLQGLINLENELIIQVDPIFSEEETISYIKENKFTGFEQRLVWEYLQRPPMKIAEKK